MKRVSKRFKCLKNQDTTVYNLAAVKEKIPDDGVTILEVLKMLPNLTSLYELDKLNFKGQFCWFNDIVIVGEPNGTEELLARCCPRIESFTDDWWDYDTDNRHLFP